MKEKPKQNTPNRKSNVGKEIPSFPEESNKARTKREIGEQKGSTHSYEQPFLPN